MFRITFLWLLGFCMVITEISSVEDDVLNYIVKDFREVIEEELKQNNINCNTYLNYCESDEAEILLLDCKSVLKQYLCDKLTDDESLKAIYIKAKQYVEKLAEEEENRLGTGHVDE